MTKNNLPSNLEAERFLLSACMNHIDALNEAMSDLNSDDFFDHDHASIFQVLNELYSLGKKCNSQSVVSTLGNSATVQLTQKIHEIYYLYEDHETIKTHIEKIKEASRLRSIYRSASIISDMVLKGSKNSDDISSYGMDAFSNISNNGQIFSRGAKDIIDDFQDGKSFEEIIKNKKLLVENGKSPYDGVKCGFKRLDKILGSFKNGCLHYIGARPSVGKTTFGLNLIHKILESDENIRATFFSLEMTKQSIVEKILCMRAEVSYRDYQSLNLNQNQYSRMLSESRKIKNNIFIDDRPANIVNLKARIRREVKVNKSKIIFIDYLTLIKSSGNFSSGHERVNEVSKGLQEIAQELNIPVICFAQLNRSSTQRMDKRPTLSDFRESGSLEEDADVCILLHRPAYYDPCDGDKSLHVNIAKNRMSGELDVIKFDWHQSNSGKFIERDLIQNEIKQGFKNASNSTW